jgi:hypothetical protein
MSDQKQKQKEKQKPVKVEEPVVPAIEFERPNPHGWYSVVFPHITEDKVIIELWLNDALKWQRERGIKRFSWTFVHGVEKKFQSHISPIFFFKDSLEAMSAVWRFNGELIT